MRLSKMLKDTRMSLDEVQKCGSNLARSPPWATAGSRFWGVWAWAWRGAERVAAAPAAAAPWRRSRRVIWVIERLLDLGGAPYMVPGTGLCQGRAKRVRLLP